MWDSDEGDSLHDEPIQQGTNDERIFVKKITPDHLSEVIRSKDKTELGRIFEEVPEIDIAEAANEIDIKELIVLFRDVTSEQTAPLFDSLSQERKEDLVKAMTDKDLVKVINEQAADDLADAVGDMPANLAIKVLHATDKDIRQEINRLMKFKPDTAGAIMTTEFLEFKETLTVGEAIDKIREIGREAETVYTIFVRNNRRKFVGTVHLDDLIFSKQGERLEDIMDKTAPSCHVNTDKEEVANIIRRYDLNAVAVLNDDDCLTGIVTVDDAVDVLTEEANEDIQKMSAVSPIENSYLETSSTQMALKCVPWLVILLVLGTLSSMVLSQFENSLSVVPVLAAFIPVLMDGGGNSGGQTTTLMVRGLAMKEFEPKDYGRIIWKESRTAALTGLIVAAFAFLWFIVELYCGIVQLDNEVGVVMSVWNGNCWNLDFLEKALRISLVVSLSLGSTIFVSKVIACSLPMGVAALKKDPALMSEPLLTTIADVAALLIYFGLAEIFLLHIAW